MKDPRTNFRFFMGLLISTLVLALINYLDFSRSEFITDAWYVHGFPFTFYRHGGFAHEHGFIWSGFLADLILTALLGVVIGWAWNKISKHRASAM